MRIRLLTGRAGDGWTQEAGEVLDLPDSEARRLISAWQAEPLEVATGRTGTETAANRVGKPNLRSDR